MKKHTVKVVLLLMFTLGLVPHFDSTNNQLKVLSTNDAKAYMFVERGTIGLYSYTIPVIIDGEDGCFSDGQLAVWTSTCIPFPADCGERIFRTGNTRRVSDWVCIPQ